MSLLVTVDWLHEHISNPNLRIIDVRWYLPEPNRGSLEYQAGHIPGAIYLDINTDLSAPRGQGPGRHPLPQPATFAATAGKAGIGPETHVVAYDSSGGASALRLWWLLRYFGHTNFSLLDGGWQAWQAAGLAIETRVPDVAPAIFIATPHPELVVAAPTVEALRHNPATLLLDARAAERYEGRVEPIDPRAGHIPGAVSAPFAANITPDGRIRSAAELHARFAALGATTSETIVCYCGSGVTAAHNLFALELAGISGGLLYEGSWSDWSSDADRPAATGSEP
jgi:thiosulfate/3-mercaptopyruvate sulfurtransferase